MTIGLVMIVRDDEEALRRCLPTLKGLIDYWTIVDTGSGRSPWKTLRKALRDVPGELHEREWLSFGHNRGQALRLARGHADWLLMLDADMTVTFHEGLRGWLADDPDPEVGAWNIEIVEAGTVYQLPLLLRDLDWQYVGETHEYLDPAGRKQRTLHGLTVTHHADGALRPEKHERDIRLLAAGVEAGDPRAVFYTARALECLDRNAEAVALYERRALMGGFEEERWYARYSAARLQDDVPALLLAHKRRPWRPEPLLAAARATASKGANGDMLFLEQVTG